MSQHLEDGSGALSVLVTGGSGFIASHLILQLLRAGYKVRTTIRTPSREKDLRDVLQKAGADVENLSFAVADLTKDEGWAEAMQGCTFVQHVASPFPGATPKDENELIVPAREGTLRVLRFARDAGVKRVILTSSFAAIGYGHEQMPLFTEDHWSVLDGKIPVPAYHKSKTLAEKSAWDFIQNEGGNMELAVINPTGVFGPVLSPDFSTSIQIIEKMMKGKLPGCPKISFGVVDVRDLAQLHILAMTDPAAAGQRFIGTCDNGPFAMIDLANVLRDGRPAHAERLPTWELPNLLVRAIALFRADLRVILPELGVQKLINNEKSKSVLGWKPRSFEECVLDTADSLVEHGVV
ncbi:NAD dependent epimerase/dehydratase [Penicillium nucicola]|uniref:NAD dependent epimerase/dehydratase n=1 Tax=Penicillium nucicola TaxID=1850975 RepID=UPI00254596F2|nr:NAD dependent epimerase/dehydratase [Penicillium nucicola]KAJ5748219.1 NAD dependent epimerase/dehydratase [Penicillium nucicola]